MWEVLNRTFRRIALATVGIVLCLTVAFYSATIVSSLQWLKGALIGPSPVSVVSTASKINVRTNTTDLNALKLEQEIHSYDQNDTHIQVFNTIAELWGQRNLYIFSKQLDIPDTFRRLAAKRNLRVTLVKGSLDDLIRFNLPFIAVSNVTGDLGAYCYAVTSAKGNVLTVSPTLFDNSTISKDVFASNVSGTFYLVWQNHGNIPETLSKGEKRFEIRALQRLLQQAGFYNEAVNGTYTTATIRAVNSFQHAMGIASDESLGEITLAALIRFDTAHKIPSLTLDKNRGKP
jgi:hypothetical protein